MNKAEAAAIAAEWLDRLRSEPFATLAARVGTPSATEKISRGGVLYQVEVMYQWDSEPGGNVRVIIAIDDAGLRALLPLTSDFIKSPAEQLVGE